MNTTIIPVLLFLFLASVVASVTAAADITSLLDRISSLQLQTNDVFDVDNRVVVTNQAMGARCAVAADFDGDGLLDLVSASSNDNAVSWYRNEGNHTFSIKQQITWSSLGSRIVTVADIDGDGDMDVVGASYYDSSLRWFENVNISTGIFESHLISDGVNEGQGVTVADIDNDGDADIISASSGDNTIAVFKNIDHGKFCEIKDIVDDNAVGARTVVAADLNGDGWIDLASASKDDSTVAWYPNDGTGHFPTKLIISQGDESAGAYSLVSVDIDQDGDYDLVVASNGNDHVSLWRNIDGKGTFEKTLIYDNADFVLSVTAVDFDGDGDMDVASASFFDGHVNWYENIDGQGYEWLNHTIYVGIQGHYVSYADMDGDGDDDLIAVTHAENTVAVYYATTSCDTDGAVKQDCCHVGTAWNGTACESCPYGTYGTGHGREATCLACPRDSCTIPGHNFIPATCSGITGCMDIDVSIAECTCPAHTMKNPETDACAACPAGQVRPANPNIVRDTSTLGNYTEWEYEQGVCYVPKAKDYTPLIIGVSVGGALFILILFIVWKRQSALAKADAMWKIDKKEIEYDDPVLILGKGSFGEVVKGYYRGTAVAIKRALPDMDGEGDATSGMGSSGTGSKLSGNGSSQINGITSEIKGIQSKSFFQRSGFMSSNVLSLLTMGGKSVTQKELKQSFIREMRTLSKLRHPCITTVMGAVLGEKPFLVMEWMENGSLRDLLSNPMFPLDPEQTLPLIRDILQGMRFLHAANPPIVHGDLKCANVLVDGNFRAKIADFGFSVRRRMVGTPYFMAPELLKGGHSTTQSDVYAFGVLLWEVMTHKIPYEGLDMEPKEILVKVREGELRPDCQSDKLDQELVECMQDCWAQEPEMRPNLQDLEMKIIPLCGQTLFSMMQERNSHANKQSSLIQDVFPEHIAKDLLAGKKVEPEHHECVSIFFSDIVGFTTISSTLSAAEVSDLLDRLYTIFDELAGKHGVFKLETIGDAWVGATNLTRSQDDHAARIARFSLDAVHAAQKTPIHRERLEMGNVKIRVGFHSGPVVSSVVGTRNPRFCLFGDTMNTASRMESTSTELRIQCTQIASKLAKAQDDSLNFHYRGKTSVKGKGRLKTYWLYDSKNECADTVTTTGLDDSVQLNVSADELSSKDFSNHGDDVEMAPPVRKVNFDTTPPQNQQHEQEQKDVETAPELQANQHLGPYSLKLKQFLDDQNIA